MSNKQRGNTNAILISQKVDKSYKLSETLKYLTIKDAEYYRSDLATINDTKVDPESDPKTVTHNIDKNKRKVTDASN